MKFSMLLRTTMLLSLFCCISSCQGQRNTKDLTEQSKAFSIGQKVTRLDPQASILYQDQANNYWFGSKEKGVYLYDDENLVLYTVQDGLCGTHILGMQEDKLGNIYFDTPNGVCRFDGQQFTTLPVKENSATSKEWTSKPDDLWFRMGWEKKGPYRFDGEYLHPLEFPKSKIEEELYAQYPNISYNPYSIYSSFKDSKGRLWFGTADLGIYRFDGKRVSWMSDQQLMTTPEGGAFGIRSIVEDKEGYFWFCNTNYKYKILPDDAESIEKGLINYEREKGIEGKEASSDYFMSMIKDNQGNLWMANPDGVWRYDGTERTPFTIKSGAKALSLASIYKDQQGIIWIGTEQKLLYQFDGKSLKPFRLKIKNKE